MGVTPTYGWRIPNLGDLADAAVAFTNALGDVEGTVKDSTISEYVPAWTSDGDTQPSGASLRKGWYRVDNGVCHIAIYLTAGASVSGGTGSLFLSLPLAARASVPRQAMPAYLVSTASGGGIFNGFAHLVGGTTTLYIYLPASSTDVRLNRWRNATNGNATGTGVPLIAGTWALQSGSELVVSGSYLL